MFDFTHYVPVLKAKGGEFGKTKEDQGAEDQGAKTKVPDQGACYEDSQELTSCVFPSMLSFLLFFSS